MFKLFNSFFSLLYPAYCAGCGTSLFKNETLICTKCLYDFPRTGYHLEPDNKVEKLFWGRVQIEYGMAFFHFQKKSKIQNTIHHLKYRGVKEIGFELGYLIGNELKTSRYNEVDTIVPVPLHYKKERKRGFNQSVWIAKGISEAMQKEIQTGILTRIQASQSQTRKTRFERWENVEEIFRLTNVANLENKHFLLVDDVVTTGATLEACANELLKLPGCKVSIAALAVAHR